MRPATARRAFLAGALSVPATAALPATIPASDGIKEAAKALAAAMQERHGGKWVAIVDHDAGFVLIVPLPEGGAA